ncbi:MAG: hypothetical protein V1873_05240 [Verrucomicrobiota bacterium]
MSNCKLITLAIAVVVAGASVFAQEAAAPAAAPAEAAPAAAAPAAPAVQPGMKVSLPCQIYANCEDEGEQPFIPSGWMGSTDAIEFDDCWKENPHSGESCIKVSFTDPKGWGGITWQNPANNWGDDEGGVDLTGAKQLSFWARGEKGGEMVEFKMGIIARNKPFWDTAKASAGKIKLETTWKQYIIPLAAKDLNLTRILTGFVWVTQGRPDPVTFYIDDIKYE